MVYSNELIMAVGTVGWKLTLSTTDVSINPNLLETLHFSGKLTDANNVPLPGQQIDLNLRWFNKGVPNQGIWQQMPGTPQFFPPNGIMTASDGTYSMTLGPGTPGVFNGYNYITTTWDSLHFISSSGESTPLPSVMFANPTIFVVDPIGDMILSTGLVLGTLGVVWWNLRKEDKRRRKVMRDWYP